MVKTLLALLSCIIIILIAVLVISVVTPKPIQPVGDHSAPLNARPQPITEPALPVTNFEDIWHPRPESGVASSIGPKISELNFQLTGTIIEPVFSAAFILDTIAHKEDLYYEGDKIRGWVIEKIGRHQVTLRNAENKQIILSLLREQASSYLKTPADSTETAQAPLAISPTGIGPIDREFYTPAGLDKLIQTTSLDTALNMARRLPEDTVKTLLDKLPQDYLRDKLAQTNLGLSAEELAKLKPSELITSLVKIGEQALLQGGAPIYFSTRVNTSDNSPVSTHSAFDTQDKRIYACFKNEGALAKLDKVMVYWTNVAKGETVYWGCQPIDPNTPYNYIWVEEKSGWKHGSYAVALFKNAKDTNCLAQGKFEIR